MARKFIVLNETYRRSKIETTNSLVSPLYIFYHVYLSCLAVRHTEGAVEPLVYRVFETDDERWMSSSASFSLPLPCSWVATWPARFP